MSGGHKTHSIHLLQDYLLSNVGPLKELQPYLECHKNCNSLANQHTPWFDWGVAGSKLEAF